MTLNMNTTSIGLRPAGVLHSLVSSTSSSTARNISKSTREEMTFQGIAHLGECFHGEFLLKQALAHRGILSVCPSLRLIYITKVILFLELRKQLVVSNLIYRTSL